MVVTLENVSDSDDHVWLGDEQLLMGRDWRELYTHCFHWENTRQAPSLMLQAQAQMTQ